PRPNASGTCCAFGFRHRAPGRCRRFSRNATEALRSATAAASFAREPGCTRRLRRAEQRRRCLGAVRRRRPYPVRARVALRWFLPRYASSASCEHFLVRLDRARPDLDQIGVVSLRLAPRATKQSRPEGAERLEIASLR